MRTIGLWMFLGLFGICACKEAVQREEAAREEAADIEMKKLTFRVVTDAMEQFLIAQKGGDAMDTCLHASMAIAALLQDKNETYYLKFKAYENFYCAKAGVPKSGVMEGAGTPCRVPARSSTQGVCMSADECGAPFSAYAGRCPGSGKNRCCVMPD